MATRASIFEEPEIDVSGFAPRPAPDAAAPPAEQVRQVSEAARFRSREPAAAPAAPRRAHRRYRTGRNVQFNVKASQETVDAFYAISDRHGWVLGETLEHALAALERRLTATDSNVRGSSAKESNEREAPDGRFEHDKLTVT